MLRRMKERLRRLRRARRWLRVPQEPTALWHERRDVTWIEVQEGARLCAYWKDLPGIGLGPAVALHVRGREVLRYDCFGDGGHSHVFGIVDFDAPFGRLAFAETTIEGQVERAIFEIVHHAPFFAARHRDPAVRAVVLEEDALRAAAGRLRAVLAEHAARSRAWAADKEATAPRDAAR